MENKPPAYLWACLFALVGGHLVLIVAFIASFFVLPFRTPWYEAVPLMVFIWFFCTTKVECKLTEMENHLRQRLGIRRIGGFVGHYIYKPIRFLYRASKRIVKSSPARSRTRNY